MTGRAEGPATAGLEGGVAGGDEDVAMLLAQHGAARYADLETIELCLHRTAPAAEEPEPGGG